MSTTRCILVDDVQAVAMKQLAHLALHAKTDHESRLACEALLRLKRDESASETAAHSRAEVVSHHAAAGHSLPDAAPVSDHPLTPDEVRRLRTLLPHVRPERFSRKHRPGYWRQVLASHEALQPVVAARAAG